MITSLLVVPIMALLALPFVPRRARFQALRVARISRVVGDLARSEAFYRDALGFEVQGREQVDPVLLRELGLRRVGAEQSVLRLGDQTIALVQTTPPGRAYPQGSRADDLWFQHLAIVVSDMDAARARLLDTPGWAPITLGGPQTLPPEDGGAQAFKFRDLDGHPLELIRFQPGRGRAIWHEPRAPSASPFLGIDHSALTVASTNRSLRFYRTLGLAVGEQTWNQGPAQAKLDCVPNARLRVTSLRPAGGAGAGLELLAYRPAGRSAGRTAANDRVTDWTTLEVESSPAKLPRAMRDPDGHRLVLVDQREGGGSTDITGAPASGPDT